VNSGDMLKEMTAGFYPSTTHRVINPAGDDTTTHRVINPAGDDTFANVSRISIPFFLTPRPEVILSDRYTSASYLEERLSLLNR
jgi:isopenicillin N synthase-like dioxygenase